MIALVTEFGKFIEQAIYARGETFEEFGKHVGVTRTAIANWVSRDGRPHRRVCYRIAGVLQVPVEDILEMAGYVREAESEESDLGRRVGNAYIKPGTPQTRQELADQLAELERMFAAAMPTLAAAREAIQQDTERDGA